MMGTSPYTQIFTVNGDLVYKTDTGVAFVTNTYPVKIGSQLITGYGYLSDYYGFMSDVRVWSAFRTPGQIRQNMYSKLTGNEPGLLAYWPMNEGTGSTVADLTSNNNPGTITGATWAAT